MSHSHAEIVQSDIAAEQAAWQMFEAFILDNKEQLLLVAHWGDGRCGAMLGLLQQSLLTYDQRFGSVTTRTKKQPIPRELSKRVFERDAYRCVTCDAHNDLTCDHIIPESKGGPTAFENLQTMCRSCNCRKGARA